MGNWNFKSEKTDSVTWLGPKAFHTISTIGKGGFGKVQHVQEKSTRKHFAMKAMRKSRIIQKKSVNSVINERKLLWKLKNPFIVNMHSAFQDAQYLYLVMDLMRGGDLRYHLGIKRKYTEIETKFIAACIIEGLEYIHGNGILHRDIKPENLVLDSVGYVKITDFGVARLWRANNKQDTSGTWSYMAPEVMCRQDHGLSVDFYALGVIVYEFMMGRRPYAGKDRRAVRDQILSKQVQIKKQDIPINWSDLAADFWNQLIQRKPVNRLGVNGPAEVKRHPWFADFDWIALQKEEMKAPFIPPEYYNYDKIYDLSWNLWNETDKDLANIERMLKQPKGQDMFADYFYDESKNLSLTAENSQVLSVLCN